MRRLAVCCFAVVVLLAGCRKDVSGSYLAADQTAVCWLPLVQTPDNHVTGQLVCSILRSDGQIDHNSVSLTGAIDGGNITLNGGGFLGLSGATQSGTFDGNSITLTGEQAAPITFRRATLANYQSLLKDQTARSQTIISARTNAELRRRASEGEQAFETNVNQLISRMQRFESEADAHMGRFPNAEKGYAAITSKISAYVMRERQFAGNSRASNYRAQLVNAATQTSFLTDQMHFQKQSLEASLQTNIAPLENEVQTYEAACHNYTPGRVYPEPTLDEVQNHRSECGRLLILAPAFQQKYDAMSAGLSHLEDVYKHEKATQENLLQTARQLE